MITPVPTRSKRTRLLAASAFISLLVFGLSGFQRVPPDHLGVQFKRFEGGTDPTETLSPGTHWLAPWNRLYHYPVTAQDLLSETRSPSSQGNTIKVGYLVRYELEPTLITRLHKTVGPEYVEKLVRPTVDSVIRSIAGSHQLDSRETAPVDEWSRLASMQISTAMETQGLHLIYFHIQSIAVPKE